ncbi:MAG TPA: hypothetical protein EYO01_01750 [Phycisphaerales bacterium]|nr:hypothetical protein [Phycisphaerales bacterium]HIB01338.1 hypothetical protein [Phycisphaerales bacterium]HIB49731.1 hypothetical protein [Phycisphaerales bacterium]HIN84272.1 hypothetical protein [Phycisphaerales bacterium]HIO20661.1 hypothetical protein [Phycisphaerales bacterium]
MATIRFTNRLDRHVECPEETVEFLVMGSTTGGLFFSVDGGVHWKIVSSHLPLIYAVVIG